MRYVNSLSLHRSAKYTEQAKYALGYFQVLDPRPMDEVRRQEVQAIFDDIRRNHDLSPSTLHTLKKHIQAVFQQAEDDDAIPKNPVRRITLPKIVSAPKDVLSPEELMRLIEASRGYAPHPFIVLGGLLGCDPGEVGAIKRDWRRYEGCLIIPGTKNENRNRVVPATEMILRELEGYEPPFPYHKGSCRRDVQAAGFRAQIRQDGRPLYPKLLRHTFSTGMQSIGADIEVRARLLGHARKSITEGYSHADALLYRPHVEKWCKKVEESVGTGVGKNNTQDAE